MVALVGVAMLLFVATGSAAGLRLLWYAKSGAGRPALLCGNGLCLVALVGFPLGVLSGQGTAPVGEVRLSLAALSLLASGLGIACFFLFIVSVFRPRALWAHTLAGGAIACLAMAGVAIVAALALAPSRASSFEVTWGWTLAFHGVALLGFGWLAAEALGAWSTQRRRLALGLGDAAAAQRSLLWGAFGVAAAATSATLLAVLLSGEPTATSLPAQLVQALGGTVASGAIALAFVPDPGLLAKLRLVA